MCQINNSTSQLRRPFRGYRGMIYHINAVLWNADARWSLNDIKILPWFIVKMMQTTSLMATLFITNASERLALSSSQLNCSLAKWSRAASRKIANFRWTRIFITSSLSPLPPCNVTRREIGGMQSCRGYLYVGLSVAAIRGRTRGNAAHVKRERLRDIAEETRANGGGHERAEKSVYSPSRALARGSCASVVRDSECVGVLESREKIFHKKINLRRSHEKRARATNSGGLSSAISPGGFEWATNGHNQVVRRVLWHSRCITSPGLRGDCLRRATRVRCPHDRRRRFHFTASRIFVSTYIKVRNGEKLAGRESERVIAPSSARVVSLQHHIRL